MPESRAVASSSRSEQSRVDTESLRLQNPIVDVVARYGVELRRTGSSFTGRCPFHADGGRPNLVVFPRSARWACFRCDARGDAIAFVQRMESISFREAAARLGGALTAGPVALTRRRVKTARHRAMRPIDTEVLAAAVGAVLESADGRRHARSTTWQAVGLAASCSSRSALASLRVASSSRTLPGEASRPIGLGAPVCWMLTDVR